VEELYGTRYQSGSFSLINVGSGFHCLLSLPLTLTLPLTVTVTLPLTTRNVVFLVF